MLAGMAAADRDAVVRQHLVVERIDQAELRGERGRGLAPAARQVAGDLPGQPGPALRRAADHHRVGARGRERGDGIVAAADVAVDHHRNVDARLDGTHRRQSARPL